MKKSYVVPEAEILEVLVEQGFAGTTGGSGGGEDLGGGTEGDEW